jgi:uncharacterized protein YjdB
MVLEAVSIANKTDELTVGESYVLVAEIAPAEIDESVSINWESSNQSVIPVDAGHQGRDVLIRATAKGESKITLTATVVRGGEIVTFYDDVTIRVIPAELTELRLSSGVIELIRGGEYGLNFFVVPEASEADAEWSSSNESVASVNGDGLVKGLAIGEAVITVKDKSTDISASCNVKVRPVPLDEMHFSVPEISILIEESHQMEVVFKPENTDLKNVTFESDDEKIVTIDRNGVIKGVSKGVTSVYVISEDGRMRGICTVTVQHDRDRIRLVKSGGIVVINGYTTGDVNLLLINGSSRTIVTRSLKITSQGRDMYYKDINDNLEPGMSRMNSVSLNWVYEPVYTYTYIYDGRDYEVSLREIDN